MIVSQSFAETVMGYLTIDQEQERVRSHPVLRSTLLGAHEALVLSKSRAGFDAASVAAVMSLLAQLRAGAYPSLKYLVFDFARGGEAPDGAPHGFDDMVAATAELIVATPVITLAWARGRCSGLDFDFAMHCSAVVAESGASFSFEGDPFDLLGLYAALGRRLGFVKAERLIESRSELSAQEAHELMLVREVTRSEPEFSGISAYLAQFERRYNASHAIFRAQRIAEPPIDRRPVGALARR
jgi:enoyl-CoA hydratase/carnithine racemase